MATFAQFAGAFKGDLVTAGHPEYEGAIKRWAKNAERRAKCVAFVSCPEDVVLAIKYARESKLPLAVRGGGHNPAAQSSSEGGIVVDLSKYLNKVQIDPETKLAYVGGGTIWETVDQAAIKYGLASGETLCSFIIREGRILISYLYSYPPVGGTVNHVSPSITMYRT